ncbi:class I SAM-dependent methyltransferase [Thalassomonas sp. RHCl1]|uniref:class I SAM-dependent methyltransferase n=1 Tax=Thalassomonas sp. RHCl1 TaxID=2995320 RepID=UPI00248CEA66|nr:class I SAM-dependent methyltransferase [Thalassomonas sp. RHCl1]
MINDYLTSAQKLFNSGQFSKAKNAFEFIVLTQPNALEANRGLVACNAKLGNWNDAVNGILKTVKLSNFHAEDLKTLIALIEVLNLQNYIVQLEQPLTKALEIKSLEERATMVLWKQIAVKHPDAFSPHHEQLTSAIIHLLTDKLFCKLLERTIISNYLVEDLILFCRQEIFTLAMNGEAIDCYIPFLSSLACLALLNDGLYACEQEYLSLIQKYQNAAQDTKLELLLLSLTYAGFEQAMDLWHSEQNSLQQEKLINLKADFALYAKLQNSTDAGSISVESSQKVQSFYIANPYPKWKLEKVMPIDIDRYFKQCGKTKPKKMNILVAGCGTGKQLVNIALKEPNAHIIAIDLSPASISYASQMMKKYQIKNVKFMVQDILAVNTLDQRFDFIVSTGVLHHMASPEQGLAALTSVLNPDGIMYLALYSKLARQHLAGIKENILAHARLPEEKLTRQDIKAWRSQLTAEQKQSRWYGISDFFYLNGLYDLLFHPQQKEYQLPEIADMLTACQLKFKWMAAPQIKKQLKIGQTGSQFPLPASGENLHYWHQIEEKYPDAFAAMYHFFVVKEKKK